MRRELERREVDGRIGELAVLAACRQDRRLDGLDRDPGRHVVERARGGRSPWDLECPIDVEEHPAQPVASAHEDEGAQQRAAAHGALGAAHELDPPGRAHGVRAGAVLAGDLTDLGLDAELGEGPRQQVGGVAEAVVQAGRHVALGHDLLVDERLLVVGRRMAAGEPHDRLKAGVARCVARLGEARAQGVEAPEGQRRRRPVEPDGRLDLAAGHAHEQRMGDRDVEGGVLGERVAQQAHAGRQRRSAARTSRAARSPERTAPSM